MNSRTPLANSVRYHAGKWETLGTEVIVETPVTLTANGNIWMTFMCTPTELEALEAGFNYNEGVIKSKEEIELVKVCSTDDNVDIWIKSAMQQPQKWRRTSGCTSGTTAVTLDQIHPELKDDHLLTPQMVQALIKTLAKALVCIAVWMCYSARSVTDNILVIIPPIAYFVAAGFEHSIANMYLIPVSLLIKYMEDTSFFQAIDKTAADFSHVTWGNFFIANLLPVIIGNIIGGGIWSDWFIGSCTRANRKLKTVI
ncbi:MAG: hypothetical protein A2Y53_04190 [Chloroflexi bacterium RBG_16_47_49]|nr:MAG: hypothetical protein A2Y53_04190 [Chloroflexi bacterium RBG_16_47_49]